MSNRSKQCLAEQTVVCPYTCLSKVPPTFLRVTCFGRTIRVTDAAGNTTKTRYQLANTQPCLVVNALDSSTFYKYDLRNRKVAEYGTGAQPATFGYDDADNVTRLTTYRATGKVISTDPSGLKGDTTTWEYDLATGLELRKTYADGKGTVKTYDAYNNLATVTDARGVVATYTYNLNRGLITRINFSDGTPAQKFTYNFLGQLTAVQDAFGARSIGYRRYRCHSHSGDRRSSRGCSRSNSRSCCGGAFLCKPSRQ